MAVSKFGPEDWRAGFLIQIGTGEGYLVGVVQTDEDGNPITPSGGGASTNITQWGGTDTSLGQKAMAASVPVVIASDQSDLPTNIAQIGGAAVVTGGAGGVAALGGPVLPSTTARLPSSAASTNATLVKNAAGHLFSIVGYNAAATPLFLKLYNNAAAPVVGTTVPVLTLPLVPNAGFAFDLPPMFFSAGIGFALTTGAADADTGAVAVGDVLGLNLLYT